MLEVPMGSVTWPDGKTVATLFIDGSWSVPGRESIEGSLKLIYSDAYAGPQDGSFGERALHDLARDVGGTPTLIHRPGPTGEGDEQIVY